MTSVQLSFGSELAGFVFPAQGKQIGDSGAQVLLNTKSILLGQLMAKAHLAFHSLNVEGIIMIIIIYMKKLLDSDWLRKECSSSVTRVQKV